MRAAVVRRLAAATLALLAAGTGADPAGAVVGGRPATDAYPGMAALEVRGGFSCGASLVRERWALTAAHCVTDRDDRALTASDLAVQVGTSRRSAGGQRISVRRVVVHEDYGRPQTSSNDVALLELSDAPSAARPFRVVRPDERALWAAGRTVTVLGWGGQTFPVLLGATDDLMEVDVPVRDDAECAAAYAGTFGWDPATMLCAGEGTGGRDSCQGDSGGPLLARDGGGEPVVVGTVSFGLGCGVPGFFGVYGRIGEPALADWIARHAGPVQDASDRAEDDVVLGLVRARREGRVLSLRIAVRRPVRDLRVSIVRVRGESRHIVARTRRTAPRRSLTAKVRLPASGPRRRLLVRLRARDAATGDRVAVDRLLRTRG